MKGARKSQFNPQEIFSTIGVPTRSPVMAESLDCTSLPGKGKKKKLKKNKRHTTPSEMETEVSVADSSYKQGSSTLTVRQQYETKVDKNITAIGVSEKSGEEISYQGKQKNKKKKKKVKTKSIVEGKSKLQQQSKEGEVEDVAESVDSGCVADSPSEIAENLTDWPQVGTVLLEENKFVSNLLMWMPVAKEDETEEKGGKKRKAENKSGPNIKRVKDDQITGDLRAIYQKNIADLKKRRGAGKMRKGEIKQERKMNRKLKNLNLNIGTVDKMQREKNLMALVRERMKTETIDNKDANPAKPMPIYNNQGELVFSKFDFSNNTGEDLDTNMKSKNLKQILTQALKEKEKAKRLEQKGQKQAAVGVIEQRAWSSALQKAEGNKVRDDVDLLKRTIKKQELKKKRTHKKWEGRQQRQEKQKSTKDATRKNNLMTRKEAKRDKKLSKMKKKGHVVPGF